MLDQVKYAGRSAPRLCRARPGRRQRTYKESSAELLKHLPAAGPLRTSSTLVNAARSGWIVDRVAKLGVMRRRMSSPMPIALPCACCRGRRHCGSRRADCRGVNDHVNGQADPGCIKSGSETNAYIAGHSDHSYSIRPACEIGGLGSARSRATATSRATRATCSTSTRTATPSLSTGRPASPTRRPSTSAGSRRARCSTPSSAWPGRRHRWSCSHPTAGPWSTSTRTSTPPTPTPRPRPSP